MQISEEHRTLLRQDFNPEVAIDTYSENEIVTLNKYGVWLKALMIRGINPDTDEQRYFVEMCHGEKHPRNDIQRTWKRYQLDVMYKIATEMNLAIMDNAFTYKRVSRNFWRLSQQGHQGAIDWLVNEGQAINIPESPPLINIAEIYPRRPEKGDLLDSRALVTGSYGSAQR